MKHSPSVYLKAAASELATLIHAGSSDAARIRELKEQLQNEYPDLPVSVAPAAKTADPGIGIWKAVLKNEQTYFIRDIRHKLDWPLWADVHTLNPKGTKKRIVLLGESVARAYFYEPFYTVAKELQGLLDINDGVERNEVIDLARTSSHMHQLLEVAQSCTALNPDAVIIFAGNNWISALNASLTEKDLEKIQDAFIRESFPGIKSFLENRFEEVVKNFMGDIKAALTSKGIPVLFIIPAFNLKDWYSDEVERALIWLPEEKMKAWLQARDQARGFSMQNNAALLARAADEMVALDPSNPEGYELQAAALLLQGNWEEASYARELARDTVLMNRAISSKPRCFDIIRKTINAYAGDYGIRVLDAAVICKQYSVNDLPGRELFLDYCHHTAKGIKIIMEQTTSILLSLLRKQEVLPGQIQPSSIFPGNDTTAVAHFCAAIHNAHDGQSSEILEYHCQKAVSLSPVVKEPMLRYIDFSTRHASTMLCRAFEEIFVGGHMRQYEGGLALMHPRGRKLMDISLIDAIGRALNKVGLNPERNILQLRKKEHAVRTTGTNLLESFYSVTHYNIFKSVPAPDYLQVRTTETRFYFIAEECKSLILNIVYRTPGNDARENSINIYLNDNRQPTQRLMATNEWKNSSFTMNEDLIKDGINELLIVWPYKFKPFIPEKTVTDSSILRLLFPVLGEIYSLQAFAGRELSSAGKLHSLNKMKEIS